MKKLTTSVLAVVLSSTFAVVSAQQRDTVKTANIEEVIITGALGIQKKADAVTNAQQVVGAKELTQASANNAVQSLVGKVSGLRITNTNSSVDGSYSIVLRGNKSITGNNQALVVIDNVISSANVLAQLPNEVIENVNVIKGLQGAALYGQQGVNGVIIVTTKKGSKSEKMQFTLTSSVDISQAFKFPKIQTKYGKGVQDESFSDADFGGTNYVPWENTSWGPAFDGPLGGQSVPSGLPQADGQFIYDKYAPVKNHFSKFFKNGVIYQNGLSMNVGGSDAYAFFSINRLENEFVVEGDKLKRNSFLLKAGKKLGNLRVDGTVNYISKIVNQTNAGLYDDLIQLPSTNDVRRYRNSGIPGYATLYATNPYWTSENERLDQVSDYLSGIIALNYEINKNINVNYTGNIRLNNTKNENHNNGFDPTTYTYENTGVPYLDGANLSAISSSDVIAYYYNHKYSNRNYYGDLTVNFNYDLSSDLNLKVNVGNNIQDNYATAASVGGQGLLIPGIYNVSNVSNLTSLTSRATQLDGFVMDNYTIRSRSIAGYANLDLAFRDYLYLNGTFRLEESSTLSTYINGERNNKAYAYYSAGLSFIPTKAFKGLGDSFINYMKIAPSYTRVGNTSSINAYDTTPTAVIPTGFPYGQPSFINDTTPTDLLVQPEFVNTGDLNVVIGMFKDRIRLEGSIYQSDTDGLITNRSVSSASGLARLKGNVGKMRLRGYEAELAITPIKTQNVTWDLRANIAASESEVLSLDAGVNDVALLSYTSPAVGIYAVVGQSSKEIRGTAYTRDAQGRIIVDAGGKPIIGNQLVGLGKVDPDYILGFNTSLRVKGVTLSATMDYRHGGHFVSFTKGLLAFTGGLQETADFDRSQGYVVPNSVVNTAPAGQTPVYATNTTPIGSADYSGVTNYFASNAFRTVGENLVVSSDAFKVREIGLSYDLPKSILSGTFVDSFTFGLFAKNPILVYAKDNQNFNDPETSSTTGNGGGIAVTGQYPTTRSFGVNLKATF